MSSDKKKAAGRAFRRIAALALLTTLFTGAIGSKAYIDTGRDTRPAPAKAEYTLANTGSYELLYETDTMQYFFRDDRDIIAAVDKRSGYTWKTGIDVPFSKELKANIAAAKTDEEKAAASEPKEKNLNTTYIGIANSLVTVEYSELETTKFTSSASEEGSSSSLSKLEGGDHKWRLDVDFESIDLKVAVYITFGEDSISYDVPFSEISGGGLHSVTAIILTPFLGASGGEAEVYDPETGKYGSSQPKYKIPGYVFVPDGSGSLIRFQDNSVAFTAYVGDVYGADPATESYYYNELSDSVPVKNPVMPVYGIAHGDGQAAFVAWAEKGAEYMDIVVNPEETKKVKYTWAYPRFEYNMTYYQVYNNAGSGYFTLMENPNSFDISMTYRFLSGDGSTGYKADYTGMALAYREHLIDTGVLTEKVEADGDIPMRVDFLMSDVKKSVVGTEQVVTTDVDGVREILGDLSAQGINNVNSGLIGWQKKAETLAKPYAYRFTSKVGRKGEFEELFTDFAAKGTDISYSRDFVTINKKMISFYTSAAKHVNTWYLMTDKSVLYPANCPIFETGYALPTKTAEWIKKLSGKVSDYSESFTITGASNILTSTYDRNGVVSSLTDAEELIRNAVAAAGENMKINLVNPNQYLWEYTDRYLQAPVGTSQYVFETDSVPFLQMVLHGTMEVYGPYSNFSFYTDSDILRMIDYNISPSFIFTKEPSYQLADTVSSDMYSTEYEQYRKLTKKVYDGVNSILSQIRGYEWIGREVLESGVIVNTYVKNGAKAQVIINYTDRDVNHLGTVTKALSASVVK
ncbi:MAG: hypothetical protein IK001_04075 [Lachnospiraceae bacterium]|nr:hypothetical protein [Lachnospiraceae bacterium]